MLKPQIQKSVSSFEGPSQDTRKTLIISKHKYIFDHSTELKTDIKNQKLLYVIYEQNKLKKRIHKTNN